jgi:hypothetical protein
MKYKRDRARFDRDEANEPVEEMKERIGPTRQLHDDLAAKNLETTLECDRSAENSHVGPDTNQRLKPTPSQDGETSASDRDSATGSESTDQYEIYAHRAQGFGFGPRTPQACDDDIRGPFDDDIPGPFDESTQPGSSIPEVESDPAEEDDSDHRRNASVTAQITELQFEAARLRRIIAANPERSYTEQYRLPGVEKKIEELSQKKEMSVRAGLVVRPASEQLPGLPYALLDTLDNPAHVAADASEMRAKLATEADVLELALDVAETIGATNSMERMLADQFALCHRMGMHFGKRALEEGTDATAMKMAKAATNAIAAGRATSETIMRIRRGGQQVITVQSVSVQQGANAVITGSIGRRKRGSGNAKRNRKTSKLNATASEKGGEQ